jgi:hypothetical protein
MANGPFSRIEGAHSVPTPAARGPWNPNSLHGRVIAGLLGAEIERLHGSREFLPARLTGRGGGRLNERSGDPLYVRRVVAIRRTTAECSTRPLQ